MMAILSSAEASAPNRATDRPENYPNAWRFSLTMLSVCLMAFVASIGSSIATALPKISKELNARESYVWIASIYMFAQTTVQPPCAQLCNIFGRKNPMVVSVVLFAVGSAVAGTTQSTIALIAGRTIQGSASGCIMMLSELIVCDLVPLRQRGKYVGIVLTAIALGTVVGPITGGALAEQHWRWIFYLNIPICGFILVHLIFFVNLRYKKEASWRKALSRIDWIGNILFCGSACAIMFGIIPAGISHSWSSWRTIAPIIIGGAGWITTAVFEVSDFCKEPAIPPHLFTNRTSAAGFFMSFMTSVCLQWAGFFWPVYFQMRGASPLQSAVDLLPFLLFLLPVAGVSGVVMSRIGKYRPIHAAGFLLLILGLGLNTLLTKDTPKSIWIVLQMINATGQGLIIPTLLPAIMASLAESDTAAATGVFSFLRSFGYVWGIVLSSILFNNGTQKIVWHIEDSAVRKYLSGGQAYEMISVGYIKGLSPATKDQVLNVYSESLKGIWWAAVGFGCAGALGVLIEKHIPLRQKLDTEYGLEDAQVKNPVSEVNERPSKELGAK